MLTSKWFLSFIGLCVLGVLTFFFGQPVYLKLKDIRAGQLADHALELYLESPNDASVVRNCVEKAQSAIYLSPVNYSANRTLATLTLFSNPVLSLKYWEGSRALWDSKRPIPDLDQVHYVQCLILNGQLDTAKTVLESMQPDELLEADVLYNLVKVCFLMGDKDAALSYARDMISNRYTPIHRHLLFVNICLSSEDEKIREEGENHIRFLLLNEDLMDESILWQMTQLKGMSRALSDRLERALNVRISDFEERISLVDYRVSNKIISVEQGLKTLVESLDRSDALAIIRLAEWCDSNGLPAEVVELMSVDLALKRKDWFVMYIKNLGAMKSWKSILQILTEEDCPIERFLSDILKCEAYYEDGDEVKSINSWYRARLSSSPTISDLWLLIRVGDKMGLERETEKMLRELVVVGENPERVLAYVAAREMGQQDYDGFYRILTSFKELYRNIGSIVNDWAYYTILMDRDVDVAMQEIDQMIELDPKQLRYHMTWSLGKIKQGQYREVLARLQQFKLDWKTLHPKWRFILALALAGVGEYEQGDVYLEGIDVKGLNEFEQRLFNKHYPHRRTDRSEPSQ